MLIAIINIDVLNPINIKDIAKSNKPNDEVIPNNINTNETNINTIGVIMPKPISGKILFLSIRFVFLTNLGANHKHINQIRIAVAIIVPKEIR